MEVAGQHASERHLCDEPALDPDNGQAVYWVNTSVRIGRESLRLPQSLRQDGLAPGLGVALENFRRGPVRRAESADGNGTARVDAGVQ